MSGLPRTLFAVTLSAGLTSSAAVRGNPAGEAGFPALEARLASMYEALPRNQEGLPEAAAVRYLARRFLSSEHGWLVKGLDLVPAHTDRNTTERAAHRAAELIGVPQALAEQDREAIEAALAGTPGRGFSLREAAQFAHAMENVLADADVRVMRKAHSVSKMIRNGNSPQLHMVLLNWAALYIGGAKLQDAVEQERSPEAVEKHLAAEIMSLKKEFRNDNDGEPLEMAVQTAARQAKTRRGNSAVRAMQTLRQRFDQRQAGECRVYREALSGLDKHGTGQVRFAEAYGTRMNDWALLETPEYLRAVGALDEAGKRRDNPGIVIPNYVLGMNSCREPGPRGTALCCPDECETDVLPLVEAAAGSPRATPRQIWFAASQAFRGEWQPSASAKTALKTRLRTLAARSKDGRLAVHGRVLGNWLHQAFPLICRKPVQRTSLALIDPVLLTSAWVSSGKLLLMDDAEVKVAKAHLETRWGPDGTGQDFRSFAARSSLGLDREFELIHQFYQAQKKGGLKVFEALENALKVWIMDQEPEERVVHLFAAMVAVGTLALLHFLLVLAERSGLLALPGRLAGAAWRAASLAVEGCRQRLAGIWAACMRVTAAFTRTAAALGAALASVPCACGRAAASVGSFCARQLACCWDRLVQAPAAAVAALAPLLSSASSAARESGELLAARASSVAAMVHDAVERLASFASSIASAAHDAREQFAESASSIAARQCGEHGRALSWIAACVIGGLLAIVGSTVLGIGKEHDSAVELLMIFATWVFAVGVDRITVTLWPQLEAGGTAAKLRSKLGACCQDDTLATWSPSSSHLGHVYERADFLRLRPVAESQRSPSGLQVRSCTELLQQGPASRPEARAPWKRQVRPSDEEDCSARSPAVQRKTDAPSTAEGKGLSSKEKLLFEVLCEEHKRAPEGLSEKSRLLLDVLRESRMRAEPRSHSLPEALISAPPGLAPPPGLPPPPGLAVH